jgi:hypothetical protein
MNKYIQTLIFLFFLQVFVKAQETPLSEKVFSLQDVIDLAKGQSPSAKLASTNYNTKYWQYRVYRSNYLPQLGLNAIVPNLNRSINPITQPDGTTLFIRQNLLSTSMDLSLTQKQPDFCFFSGAACRPHRSRSYKRLLWVAPPTHELSCEPGCIWNPPAHLRLQQTSMGYAHRTP